ncbi:MAG: hypothetical protein LBD06_01055 [Candidatus Accumulibacter sp.]|jgi:hypothetical protein|nr:hypothetical protein [Accumulibacter sp.]
MPGTLPRWFLGVLKWMTMYLFDLIMLIPIAIWVLLTVGGLLFLPYCLPQDFVGIGMIAYVIAAVIFLVVSGRPLDRINAAFKSRVVGWGKKREE